MARWDDEELKWDLPDCDKMQCKDCFLRAADVPELGIKGATYGYCEVYKTKPPEILFEGAACPYYIDENEPDEEDSDESK